MAIDTSALKQRSGILWVPTPDRWSPAIRGGLSGRAGGVSTGHLASLNLGSRVGDPPPLVRENLRRLSAATRENLAAAARVRLEHGNRVLQAHGPGPVGSGDALVTRVPGLPLAITVADCLPLLLAAHEHAAGIAHCGWRGILEGIVPAAVKALTDLSGLGAREIHAWIGPGIGPCCFEVSRDVAERFGSNLRVSARGNPKVKRVDLMRAVYGELEAAGLAGKRIDQAGLCTSCHADLFYSHRRDHGSTGRMLAWITLHRTHVAVHPTPVSGATTQ